MGLAVTFSLRFPEPPAQGDLEGALWGFASWPHSSGDHTPLTDSHAHFRVSGVSPLSSLEQPRPPFSQTIRSLLAQTHFPGNTGFA